MPLFGLPPSARALAPAVLALLLLSAIWGYNFVVLKRVLDYADPFAFTAARSLLGAGALFLFAFVTGRALPRPPWKPLILLGLLQTALFGALIQLALVGGGAGRTVVLVYTMPFWLVALAAPFLGERLTPGQLAAVLGAALGLVLIVQPWAGPAPLGGGTALAVLAGLVWAVAAVVARRSARAPQGGLLAMTAWQMLFGAVLLCVAVPLLPLGSLQPAPYFWAALFYSSVFATGIAWFLWLFILDRLSAGGAGLATLMVPVVGLIASWVELGERPDGVSALGMLLILVALAALSLQAIRGRRRT